MNGTEATQLTQVGHLTVLTWQMHVQISIILLIFILYHTTFYIQSCSKSYIFKPNVVPTQSPSELRAFIIHFAHDSVTIIYDFI